MVDVGLTFKLTNDDLAFDGTKNLEMVEDSDKLRQDFQILLRTQKGEDIFNTSFGADVLDMVNNPTRENLIRKTRSALAQYRFVEEIEKVIVSFDSTTRIAIISATVFITEEEVTISLGVAL